MGILNEKLAGNARESVEQSRYEPSRTGGIEADIGDGDIPLSKRVEFASKLERGEVEGVNVYACEAKWTRNANRRHGKF